MTHPLRPPPSGFQWVGRRALVGLALGATLLLGACSQPTGRAPATDARHDFVASVPITASDTRDAIEAAHNADVVVWRPDAGFAVLGLGEGADSLRTLATSSNQDAMAAPEAHAGGVSAWAGGISAWAGGVSAWAGGVSAWAGGSTSNPFPGNEDDWTRIRIAQAQQLAPKLGQGVKVAVIDTGLDLTHAAFQGKLAPQSEWKDFVDDDAHPQDVSGGSAYGHGTAVAGVILQAAPNATILPLRVLGPDGNGDVTHVVQAIDHAVAMGARVINLSLGTTTPVQALYDIVNYANSRGVPVISSSGNSGDTNVTYPAADSLDASTGGRPIGVGSVTALDVKSAFSTYGSRLEMVAPGDGIVTLYPGDRVTSASGTSFAAPWVSGTLALALAYNPKGNPASDIPNTATRVDAVNPLFSGQLGAGRLNAEAFVRKVLGL